MPNTLSKELRKLLASVTQDARDAATQAARAALENLAVHEKDFRRHMTLEQRQLRNRLRARGRALGDERDERSGAQSIEHLAEDIAYEHWHRLLFTRFLTENHLLHTDERHGAVPVTLQDCEELAADEGATDGFELACRFASLTLPGVFRPNDPVLDLTLAQNDQVELRRLLGVLPEAVFTSDDALGWTYQFWQAKRKDEVNASGKKIGADELPAVTQLFTEDYMVEFLLHNTLGAWWAGKRGPIEAATEAEARAKTAVPVRDGLGIDWTYLRFVQDRDTKKWLPAAGTFDGWPKAAKEVTFLDPCMGSGHFPVFALPILARLRMEEESLPANLAVAAVLRDNLHGLEIDPRCAQIGAFNIALTAWKLAGYQALPSLQVACSGVAPNMREVDWLAIAGDNEKLQRGMERLYRLFQMATVLGSLINPRAAEGDLLEATFRDLQPLLERALGNGTRGDGGQEMAVTARGLAKAAEILYGQYALIATNFPYLKRGNQSEQLKELATAFDEHSHSELATTFLVKALHDLNGEGTLAVVTPQSLTYQRYYVRLRKRMLEANSLRCVAKLGPGAFESISGEIVQPILLIMDRQSPSAAHKVAYADVIREANATGKARALREGRLDLLNQKQLLEGREHKISSVEASELPDLAAYCECFQGVCTGDIPRFGACFWELPREENGWVLQHSTPENTSEASGCTQMLYWEDGKGVLYRQVVERLGEAGASSWIRGLEAWGSQGVAIAQMQSLRAGRYTGKCFDNNTAVIIPRSRDDLPAVFEYCRSEEYRDAVRESDQSIKISNKTLLKVPFDLSYWQTVAANKYPHGMPKPRSEDPTQWLFSGHPAAAAQPLHAAVARLVGYQWPRQTGSSCPDCPSLAPDGLEECADADGIVCLSPINRERSAAQRLRELLATALVTVDERMLLTAAGAKRGNAASLEEWLRDGVFQQHCELFHHRPFVWHVWDGRKDGFHALVNYHRLDHANLQKLTYTYLGDWIRQQEEEAEADKAGAGLRLGAARELQGKLAAILEGEAPYDIFIRWKPVSEQAIGWHPDLNDGVRLNIRPFAEAGVLRGRVNVKWEKDRGKEPVRDKGEFPWFWCETEPGKDPKPGRQFVGHRWNNVHLTLAAKRAARGKA